MIYQPPPGLEFDPVPHEYRYHGRIVPSVTQILKGAGHISGFYKGTAGRDRGTAVHGATELMDTIGLPVDSFPDEIRPYLLAWEEFRASPDVEILDVELLVYHPRHGYAGQADRRIRFRGIPAIVDIKTGSSAVWHRLQLAGYADAIDELADEQTRAGIVVRLTPKGPKVDIWAEEIDGAEPFLPCRHEWRRSMFRYMAQSAMHHKGKTNEQHYPVR